MIVFVKTKVMDSLIFSISTKRFLSFLNIPKNLLARPFIVSCEITIIDLISLELSKTFFI
jgi:hypothetical protein